MPQSQPTLPATKDALQRLIDGLQTLVREHLALARAEAKEDLRQMGRDLVYGAAGMPMIAVGYLMLMTAVGFLLALWLPNWAAFGIVALVNLGAGTLLSLVAKKKLQARKPAMDASADELRRNKQWLSSLAETTRPPTNGHELHP
jgi:uncharacterized membrane protein YqjE